MVQLGKFIKRMPPWSRVLVGLVGGVATGWFLGADAEIFQPIGTMFINAIMMMVAPVVFISLVCGVISVKDPAKMGRVASKTFLIYFSTTALGTIVALAFSLFFQPGKGKAVFARDLIEPSQDVASGASLSLIDRLVDLIPSNPIAAFSDGNVLQIIFIATLVGVAINMAGIAARPVEKLFQSSLVIVLKFVDIIMLTAPVGIFALMAVVTGKEGADVLTALAKMVGVGYLSLTIVLIGVYSIYLILFARLNPLPFFKKMIETQLVAFSTTSSAASLPVGLRVSEQKLGVSRSITSFVLPMGATVNMNGLSTCMGVYVVFAANLYGIELGPVDLLTIIATSAIAAIGCAGVPTGGMIVLPMVLSSVGIPLGAVGMITAVSRIMDMLSTAVNVSGDSLAAVIVAKSEGEFDEDCYYDKDSSVDEKDHIESDQPSKVAAKTARA